MTVSPIWQQHLDGGAEISLVITAETARELDTEIVDAINWLARARQMARVGDQLAGKSQVEIQLTAREYAVAKQASKGLSNREIGKVLGITTHTVESHLKSAYKKLGVGNRSELTIRVNGNV